MTRNIIYNALRTPDGTILESLHRHDFRTYVDKNGKTYMIDGGCDYVRCSANGDEEFITVYDDEPFERVRQYAYRLGYGKPGSSDYGRFRKTTLAQMSDEHLQASLDYVTNKGGDHWCLLLREKMFRAEWEISLQDS